ncbi:MAG: acyltransferase [Actinomycetia bacterium]|nr:acyltransferase [Actinomycetes bacterium]
MDREKIRIASVEWIRFFASICVILFHFEALYFGEHEYFGHLGVVVDFFFMLSGFLLMRSAMNKDELTSEKSALTESIEYVIGRAKKFYLPYLLAFAMVFILTTIAAHMTDLGQIVSRLFHFKWEILLLQMAGFNPSPAFDVDYLVGSAWYLSSMLLAMLPIYYLATRHRKTFTNFIAPLTILFFYCYIMQTYGTVDVGNEFAGFIMLGNLRGFAGLSAGCLCYAFYDRVRDATWSPATAFGLGTLEIACLLALPGLILLRSFISEADVLFWVLIFALLIVLCFVGRTPIARFLNSHFTRLGTYLGRLSLYLYLFHWFFVLLFVIYFPAMSYGLGALLYCASVILFSMVAMWFFDLLWTRSHPQRLPEKVC